MRRKTWQDVVDASRERSLSRQADAFLKKHDRGPEYVENLHHRECDCRVCVNARLRGVEKLRCVRAKNRSRR